MKARIATGLLVAGVALLAGSAGVVALLLGGGLGVGLWAVGPRLASSRKRVTSTSATVARRRVDLPSDPPTFPL